MVARINQTSMLSTTSVGTLHNIVVVEIDGGMNSFGAQTF
jgi:hypothetical protein